MKHTMAYLEVWLNLGVVGLVIVLAFLLISLFQRLRQIEDIAHFCNARPDFLDCFALLRLY